MGDWDCCTACEPKHDHPLIKYKKASKTHANASFNGLSEIFGNLSMHVPEQKVDEDEEDEFADIYDDNEASETVIDCICGTKMALVRAKDAYTRCNTVYCDICGEQFLESKVWHCPLGYDAKHHANGYDVCTKCASKKKKAAKEESEENEIEIDEDMKSELDSTTSETESAVVVEKMEEVEKEEAKENVKEEEEEEEDKVEIEKF